MDVLLISFVHVHRSLKLLKLVVSCELVYKCRSFGSRIGENVINSFHAKTFPFRYR